MHGTRSRNIGELSCFSLAVSSLFQISHTATTQFPALIQPVVSVSFLSILPSHLLGFLDPLSSGATLSSISRWPQHQVRSLHYHKPASSSQYLMYFQKILACRAGSQRNCLNRRWRVWKRAMVGAEAGAVVDSSQ
ncbi:hypothetical protein MVEN_01655000 [Mycena venus]|uniref:Uncharacterized protein n=1 Tax=Mycena venus TaxID=2733690 RepID=A0A8H6XQU9_9AGAR|nr:hypothetical protein MVEN_01655000 [Mycena venus]